MPLVATTGNKPNGLPYRHYFFKLGEGNTVAFFEYPNVVERHKDAGVPEEGWLQIDHIAFNVEDEAALLALRERLLSKGEDVTVVVDHKIVKSIYFTDPNGISARGQLLGAGPRPPPSPTTVTRSSSTTRTRCRRHGPRCR